MPPPIDGVRRYRVTARSVDFHITEAGDPNGRPVLALHGWPHHHYTYRDLLSSPPEGLRIIAPDLPGYGWSGPAPHRWAKSDVALDVLALMDELGLDRVLLVGHDWGAFVGYLLVLSHPERIEGFVAASMSHPWNSRSRLFFSSWRFGHMPLNAVMGSWLVRRTSFLDRVLFPIAAGDDRDRIRDDFRVYSARFRDPVCAGVTRDTYRTFVLREFPALLKAGANVPSTDVPIRAVVGTKDIISPAMAGAETAHASDYEVEFVPGVGHFMLDERPEVVRRRLVELAGLGL